MPDIDVTETSFQKRGILDADAVFAVLPGWLKAKKYTVVESEVIHKGDERETTWNAWLNVTPFLKYKISTEILTRKMVPKEVKGKKLYDTIIRGTVTGKIETDWQKKWEGSPYKEYMRMVREKVFMRFDIIARKKVVKETCWQLRDALKAAGGGLFGKDV